MVKLQTLVICIASILLLYFAPVSISGEKNSGVAPSFSNSEVMAFGRSGPFIPYLAQSTSLVRASDLWAKGVIGTGQVVAIIDTGVDKSHPMFIGKVVSEACYSTTLTATPPTASTVSLCPGGVAESILPGAGRNCVAPWLGCGHGTMVAGIAVGRSAPRFGMANGAKIISIKVASGIPSTRKLHYYEGDIIKALKRVYALRTVYKIAAINLSLATDEVYPGYCRTIDGELEDWVGKLRVAGIATIAGSGNTSALGKIGYPACIRGVIAVGNSTKSDLLHETSNHSPRVNLLAPGEDIESARPGAGYARDTGTSLSTPHVVGAFAQLRQAKPAASVDEVLNALACSGKTIDKRARSAVGRVDVNPAAPRIDMIGAYNYLLKSRPSARTWLFDSVLDYNDWSPLRGSFRVAGSSLRLSPLQAGIVGTKVSNCHSNIDVTVRLMRIDPTGCWNSGFMFKTRTDFKTKNVSGYWVAFNGCSWNNPLIAGTAVFWKLDRQNYGTGDWSGSLLCHASIPISMSGYNTLRVSSRGAHHVLYLNGQLACNLRDSTFQSGDIVLRANLPTDTRGHAVAFSDVRVATSSQSAASEADVPARESQPLPIPAGHSPVGINLPIR